MFNWKLPVIGVLLVGMSFVLTGCSRKNNDTNSNQKIVLNYWRPIDDAAVFETFVKAFEKKYANVKINYVQKDIATYEIDSLNALATTDQGPDIWSIPNDWIERHKDKIIAAPQGLLIPPNVDKKKNKKSDEELFHDRFPAIADQLLIDGKVFGVPLSIDSLVVYYNPALMQQTIDIMKEKNRGSTDEKANREYYDNSRLLRKTPASWDEFRTQIQLITGNNDGSYSAVALGTSNNVAHSEDILSLLMLQNGTKMTNEKGTEAIFNLPQKNALGEEVRPGTAALELYNAFANPAKPEIYSWSVDRPNAFQAFAEGKVAMIFGYQDDEKTLKNLNPKLRFQVAPVPQISSTITEVEKVAYGRYFAETVTKNSKNSKAAWTFVQYIAERNSLSAYSNASGRPTSDVSKTSGPTGAQAKYAKTWNHGPDPAGANQAINKAIQDLVLGKVSAQIAVDTAAARISSLMQKTNN